MRDFDDLTHLKAVLVRKYLGTAGIYGIGISRGSAALKIFVEPGASDELESVLAAVRSDAAPFSVLVISTAGTAERGPD